MIFGKFWRAIKAQVNKLANFFWTADPIAQMQYEYDKAVEDMKGCLLYTSPSPRDRQKSRMPSSA